MIERGKSKESKGFYIYILKKEKEKKRNGGSEWNY